MSGASRSRSSPRSSARPAPRATTIVGLSRKHILESINGSLRRLQTDYVDLYQAHRYDYETPLEETMQAFADLVRQGKVLYIGVSEWTAEQLRDGHALAKELGFQLISNQPQYSMLWRVIEAEVVPTSRELGISQIVWSPIAQGVLTGKYLPGQQPPEGSRATDDKGGADMIAALPERRRADPRAAAEADRRRARAVDGAAGRRLGAAERQRGHRDHRRIPTGAGARERRRPPASRSPPSCWPGSTRCSATSSSATRRRRSRARRRPARPDSRNVRPRAHRQRESVLDGSTR